MHRQRLGCGGQAALLEGPSTSSAAGIQIINRDSGLALEGKSVWLIPTVGTLFVFMGSMNRNS